ncbi:MAG: branched-chain amino acid ABC transporter permease [Magnetococcales bacterium]|nr:branched-chain amino acid ABC transporter permease [Magnetococcales bacterium]
MDILLLAILRACDYALIAVGFALVFGSCRVLNLMHGSFVMLGAYGAHLSTVLLTGEQSASSGMTFTAVVLSTGAVALLGFGFFRLLQITHRTRSEEVLAISLTGNLFIAALVKYRFGTEGANVLPILEGVSEWFGVSLPNNDLLTPPAAIITLGTLWWWLNRTRSGLALRAVADDATAATLMGIQADRLLALAVGVAAFIAALAGALRAPSLTLSHAMWIPPLLVSFAVVVFGGRNNLLGVVASALFLAGVETTTSYLWNESASQYVALLMVVAGLYLFPQGLVGAPRHENR